MTKKAQSNLLVLLLAIMPVFSAIAAVGGSPGSPAISSDPVSQYLANVTLGDLWALQLVLGLVQCALLGSIHGHQR